MTVETYIIFILSSIIVTFTPGPTVLLSINYALRYGKTIAKYAVPAVLVGDVIASIIAFSGLGIMLKYSGGLFFILKILGSLYIFTLGLVDIFSKSSYEKKHDELSTLPKRKVFTRIMLVTAFNPKSIIFLLAFFPHFLNPEAENFSQIVILGVTFIIIGIFCTLFYTFAASKIYLLINNQLVSRNLHYFTGSLLCIIGVLILM